MAKKVEEQVRELEERFQEKIDTKLKEVEKIKEEYQSRIIAINEIAEKKTKIDDFYAYFFKPGKEGKETLEDTVKKCIESLQADRKEAGENYSKIKEVYDELLGFPVITRQYLAKGESPPSGVQQHKAEDGRSFYNVKYRDPGLKNDIENFFEEVKKKHENSGKQIEKLLSGATSAGLASSYKKAARDCFLGASFWNLVFFASVALLILLPYGVLTGGIVPLDLFADPDPWYAWLKRFLAALPFVVPAVWLGIHAAKSSHTHRRLCSEYNHKWAVASSFASMKNQVETMTGTDNDLALMKQLLDNTIKMHAENPSQTMPEKFQHDFPGYYLLDRIISMDVFKTLNLAKPNEILDAIRAVSDGIKDNSKLEKAEDKKSDNTP